MMGIKTVSASNPNKNSVCCRGIRIIKSDQCNWELSRPMMILDPYFGIQMCDHTPDSQIRTCRANRTSDLRFKLLETKLESTLKSSLEIKEEKIAALEARLQESSNLNQQLRQELKTVRNVVFWLCCIQMLSTTTIQKTLPKKKTYNQAKTPVCSQEN